MSKKAKRSPKTNVTFYVTKYEYKFVTCAWVLHHKHFSPIHSVNLKSKQKWFTLQHDPVWIFLPPFPNCEYSVVNLINFVYGDVRSDNDLNQLMFIIRNSGLFVVNHDTQHYKQAWRKITEKEVKRVEVGQRIWSMIGHEPNKQWFCNIKHT